MNIPSIIMNYISIKQIWEDIKNGVDVVTRTPLQSREQINQFRERLAQLISFFSWVVIGFFGAEKEYLIQEIQPFVIIIGTADKNKLTNEACCYLREVLEYARRNDINIEDTLKEHSQIYRNLQIANILCKIVSSGNSVSSEDIVNLCKLIPIEDGDNSIFRQILLRIKEYLESQDYEVPKELIETLDKFAKPKERNYWDEYQKMLREFDEKGRELHEEAKREWELVESGKAEDPIGSIQEIIWSLSGAVVYNFALRRFKPVREAYEIFLKAYEFARENNLFKTKLSEDTWLGKLKRVNLKWGNDVMWHEDYRVISNRIIRLTRIAEFMMWKRRIPEFLYANPYINLGGDYEHNDPPLWALTKGLMMILNHNRSKGVLPSVELQEEVLNHALRLNLPWPKKTEVWECSDGICSVFKGELNEKAIKELKRNIWGDDIVFYCGKDIMIGYSRKRKLGYACTKNKDEGTYFLRMFDRHHQE